MPNNLPASFDDQGLQWAWDSTSLKRADECPRKYYYEVIEGWISPYKNVNLWFGGIYASSLELYHKLVAGGATKEEALRETVREAMVLTWTHDLDEDGERIPGTGQATTFDDANKTRETLIRTIVWYFDFYGEDPLSTYITSEGKAAVEYSFQIPADDGITLCGHIDRVCTDEEGHIYVQDQKTTKITLSPYYFSKFKPDIQFSLYTFAGKFIYNAPVRGVIIDAAQVAVGFSRFSRAPVLHTDDELNESYDEWMGLIATTRQHTLDNHFPRRPASCNNYGGCQFRPVCGRPPMVRENFLKADFVKRERWDPIKRR